MHDVRLLHSARHRTRIPADMRFQLRCQALRKSKRVIHFHHEYHDNVPAFLRNSFPFTGNTGYKPGTGATEAYEVLGAGESTSLWASTRSEVSQYAGGFYITDWMTYLGESPRETGCVVRPVYCE